VAEETINYTGKLLMAMPHMTDPRFAKSVIYICIHNPQGAMGLIINRVIEGLAFKDLTQQLNIKTENCQHLDTPVYFGGPVDANRGFVLHSKDKLSEHSLLISDDIVLSATLEMLEFIGKGQGPQNVIIALGYTGWGPGQLDIEVQNNGWLVTSPQLNVVFDPQISQKWKHSVESMGIDLTMLSSEIGHA
jgi:putative transcriptional regulator